MGTITELMQLAGTGVSLVVNIEYKSTAELINLVSSVGSANGHLYLTNCHSRPVVDLMQIISTYPKNVTLDFSYLTKSKTEF